MRSQENILKKQGLIRVLVLWGNCHNVVVCCDQQFPFSFLLIGFRLGWPRQ